MTIDQTDAEGGTGPRIREARLGAGLTQRELGALVGVTADTVRGWEAGRRSPAPEHLAAVALHCRTVHEGTADGERNSSPRVAASRDERMRAVVGAVARHAAEHGYPPTLRQVKRETGFSSISVVKYWLDKCEEAGLIVRARGIARAVTLTATGCAFAEGPPASSGEPVAPPAVARDGQPPPAPEPSGGRRRPVERTTTSGRADVRRGIAVCIREARRRAGLTQRELAALVGVAIQTVRSWEAGRMKPTYEHRVAIALHCELDVDELEGPRGPEPDQLEQAVAAFRGAVAHLPEKDIESIWLFIRFRCWRRPRRGRAA